MVELGVPVPPSHAVESVKGALLIGAKLKVIGVEPPAMAREGHGKPKKSRGAPWHKRRRGHTTTRNGKRLTPNRGRAVQAIS